MPLNVDVLRNPGKYSGSDAITMKEQSLILAIKLLLESPGIDARHRRQLIDIALWKFTEASGISPHPKYNLRFVTDGARNLVVPAFLNHEHVWTRKWILDRLFERASWDLDELAAFVRLRAVACAVTVEEHALLGGQQVATGWKRYAKAQVAVWDRQAKAYLNVDADKPAAAPRLDAAPPPSPIERFDLQKLIEARAGRNATYLHRLARVARFATAVSVVAVNQQGEPTNYFRIHDAMLEEPTAAVAFPHWSGRVAFALTQQDVPNALLAEPSVGTLKNAKYAVTCRTTDDESLEIAEELLFLSLEKLRASFGD